MSFDKEQRLFNALKENFLSATGFDDYGIEIEWDKSDHYESGEKWFYSQATVELVHGKKIEIQLRIDASASGDLDIADTEVNAYEDVWEKWASYNLTARNLFRTMLFAACER